MPLGADRAMATGDAHRRSAGLDTLRALAIVLVFAFHYRSMVSHEATFGWATTVGWLGVDLFFVLSGYLIGNQLFSGIAHGERPSLTGFYARRALRTWPVFWLVLAVYFTFPMAMEGKPPPPLLSFLSFTQNIGLQPGTAFSHAWSLCVEEQFYFALPLIVLLLLRCGAGRAQAWLLLAAVLIAGIAVRTWLWTLYGRAESGQINGYYPNIYYATPCRFDEFVPGLAVAMVKNFHASWWQRMQRHGQWLLGIGVAATAAMFAVADQDFFIDGVGFGLFMTSVGYSLSAWAFALLVVAALSPTSALYRLRIPGAYSLAIWSYSIYLTHKAVAYALGRVGTEQGWSSATILIAIVLACLLVGAGLYWLVETPFLRLRERWFPSIFTHAARHVHTARAAIQR